MTPSRSAESVGSVYEITRPDAAPSMLTQAVSLGTALVKHARGGFHNVSSEEAAARMVTCRACEHFDAE